MQSVTLSTYEALNDIQSSGRVVYFICSSTTYFYTPGFPYGDDFYTNFSFLLHRPQHFKETNMVLKQIEIYGVFAKDMRHLYPIS